MKRPSRYRRRRDAVAMRVAIQADTRQLHGCGCLVCCRHVGTRTDPAQGCPCCAARVIGREGIEHGETEDT
jgi:hypothetical protein